MEEIVSLILILGIGALILLAVTDSLGDGGMTAAIMNPLSQMTAGAL